VCVCVCVCLCIQSKQMLRPYLSVRTEKIFTRQMLICQVNDDYLWEIKLL